MAFGITPYLAAASAQTQAAAAQAAQQAAQQPGVSFTQNGNPLYQGAYNPMYHTAQGQAPTIKDLASLYYKSQGQGLIGDNPHPLHAANVYSQIGFANGPFNEDILGNTADALTGQGGNPVKSANDVKKLLQARIALAGGDKNAVFQQLVGQTNNAMATQQAKKSGLSAADAQQLAASSTPTDTSGNGALTPDVMGQWFQSYVSPYMQQQQANYDMSANLFDQTVNDVLSDSNLNPQAADLLKAYAPLVSAAYHQKAENFGRNFLYGNDEQSLIGQLLKGGKKNASILKFLKGQADDGSGSASSFLSGLLTKQ